MPAARRLQALFDQILDCNQASRSDCLRMFILSRELAEACDTLDSYPTVRFFADWSLHSKLNRRSAHRLLSQIAHIVDSNRDSNPSDLVVEISRALSISNLRTELEMLYRTANLPVFMLDQPEPWIQCAGWLLQDLIDKPVIGSKFTEEEKRTGWGTTPRSFKLIADPMPGSQIEWEIELGPRVKMRGRLLKT